jgi:acetate kinase
VQCTAKHVACVVVFLQEAGDARARLALDMFVYRVRKYIGAYTAALSGRVDALIFSAGIGENSSIIRGMICEDFKVRRGSWLLCF